MRSRAGALQGRIVVVTRPEQGAADFAAALRAEGAEPVLMPLIRIVATDDAAQLSRCLRQLSEYEWIVFTSANAVGPVAALLPSAAVPTGRVAAVGPATAAAVEQRLGWPTTVVPGHYSGADLAAAMRTIAPLTGARVLWPRARAARAELPRALAHAGARLDAPEAYAVEAVAGSAHELHQAIMAGTVDAVTFTSPSAVNAFAAAGPLGTAVVVAVIGASTAAAARGHGIPVHVEPEEHTIAAMVDGLADWWRTE
jgi:uroporphyrinogen-III synthase